MLNDDVDVVYQFLKDEYGDTEIFQAMCRIKTALAEAAARLAAIRQRLRRVDKDAGCALDENLVCPCCKKLGAEKNKERWHHERSA